LSRISKSGGSNDSQLATFKFQVAANSSSPFWFSMINCVVLMQAHLVSVSRRRLKLPAALHIEQLVVEKRGRRKHSVSSCVMEKRDSFLQYQRA
jgi:hypothetical protein